jgi:hypothetical protein
MTSTDSTLAALGDALERAAGSDLADHRAPAARGRRHPRRLLGAIVAAAIVVPTVAVGATRLFSTSDVAASMPAGTLALAGTSPTCTVVHASVEFHCLLAKPPAPEVQDWKGTVEPTVDATRHVNGGCRALRSDGMEWECYLGQVAVTQQIVGPDMLGVFSSGPGVG